MKRSPDTYVFTREFGVRLRDLRLKAGLTQLELAQKLARIALSRFRELAESFPPDPRPKR